jgi:RNA polymerase sigma-70 factor, ECF subfamily
MDEHPQLTQLLNRLRSGDAEAQRAFEDEVYQRLRKIASGAMRRERSNHTLQPTALVHEFMAHLYENEPPAWADREHFYNAAARKMRLLLVDHARKHKSAKHGSGAIGLELKEGHAIQWDNPEHVLALEEAMTKLEQRFPKESRVMELSAYAGLEDDEIVELTGTSRATVQRMKRFSRAFLAKHLLGAPDPKLFKKAAPDRPPDNSQK